MKENGTCCIRRILTACPGKTRYYLIKNEEKMNHIVPNEGFLNDNCL